MHDNWVPIILFMSLAGIIVSFLFLHYKHKQRLQDTLQLAIEKGQQLSAETINSLLINNQGDGAFRTPFNDLKKGVILIFLGLALTLFGVLVADPYEYINAIAIGSFPIVMGLAYLTIWKLAAKFQQPD